MGTSTHNGGQKGGTPLVPSWLEQPDVNPQNENGLGPDGSQIPPVGDADRFRTPRGEFTRYINSGGRDSSLGRKSVSNYIRNSLGGSSNATQRMGAARSSSARLLNVAGVFASGGARAVEQYLSIENLSHKTASDAFIAITDFICPDGGPQDEGIARSAYISAIEESPEIATIKFEDLTSEIELEIPVSNVEIWDSQIHTVERMLKFLTGDLWKITLSSRAWQFNNLEEVREKSNKYDEVSLFSGGMDSLISTINLMENKKNTLLISHAGEGLTKNAQKNIVNKFDLLYPDVLHTWLDLWMVFPRDYIPAGGNDNNTRSRSFLFIGYALFAMTGMDNINELLVPENGLIALNVPLDETRVGSFSTRTTHPFYLSLWNELLVGLGLNLSVKNPYWNKTKGEMAGECKNKDVLYETMKLSFSCSSPGKARWKQLSQQHCGYCVPCLIRRAAMHR